MPFHDRPQMDASRFIQELASLNPQFSRRTFLQNFLSITSNLERVNFAYKALLENSLLPGLVRSKKSDLDARKFRLDGNEDASRKNFDGALLNYTNALIYAQSSSQMALIYADRSECLLQLKMREECIEDIDRAIGLGNPSKHQLLTRRENAIKLIPMQRAQHLGIPPLEPKENNVGITCARNCIIINQDNTFGRYIEATRDIQIGEILSVERPFSASVCDVQKLHCHYCFLRCYNPIPCRNCEYMIFCSEKCMKDGEGCHMYECRILPSLLHNGFPQSQVAGIRLSLWLRKALQEGKHNFNELKVKKGEVYQSNRYNEINSLITGVEERPPEHLLLLSFFAAIFYHLLSKYTDFFANSSSVTMEDDFKGLALQYLQTVDMNAILIHVGGEKNTMLGWGLYPFSALYSHSCNSNVVPVFYTSTMVTRATRTIRKGEQCCISYKPENGLFMSQSERQKYIYNNFFFHCCCEACINDWGPERVVISYEHFTNEIEVFLSRLDMAKKDKDSFRENATKECERLRSLLMVDNIKLLIIDLLRKCGNTVFTLKSN